MAVEGMDLPRVALAPLSVQAADPNWAVSEAKPKHASMVSPCSGTTTKSGEACYSPGAKADGCGAVRIDSDGSTASTATSQNSSSASSTTTCCTAEVSKDIAEDYLVSKDCVLGKGSSAAVCQATCKRTGKKVAVKSFVLSEMPPQARRMVRDECETHQILRHPNIVRAEEAYHSGKTLHLVMERLEGGELFDRIAASEGMAEQEAAKFTIQLLRALGYLHARRIVHRDLKPENVLFVKAGGDTLKLVDFGFAAHLPEGEVLSDTCGTVKYVAPEIVSGRSYTEKVDMWSLGAVVYAMLCARALYAGSASDVRAKSKVGQIDLCRRFHNLPRDAQDFLSSLLDKNGADRLSVRAALAHPWLEKHAKAEVEAARSEVETEYRAQAMPNSPQLRSRRRGRLQQPVSCFTSVWQCCEEALWALTHA